MTESQKAKGKRQKLALGRPGVDVEDEDREIEDQVRRICRQVAARRRRRSYLYATIWVAMGLAFMGWVAWLLLHAN